MRYTRVLFLWCLAAVIWAGCSGERQVDQHHHHDDGLPLVQGPLQLPSWAMNANIYEVNVRQYTPEGTFQAFEEHLPRLKEMGVDILWFMPIYPISEVKRKGSLGSYYAIADYSAVNPEFGTLEEFKSLVQKIHDMGMYVILDWVPNHTGWDHAWITEHPDWYMQQSDTIRHPYDESGNATDWFDVADLDYSNEAMRAAMINEMKFWLQEADVDGYRCDVAGFVPVDFWAEARKALDEVKPVFMLAEWEGEPEHFNVCFNANYGWSFHHLLNQLAKGEKNANDVMEHLASLDIKFPEHYFQMHFTSNHDENSWNGTASERMGAAEDALTVLAFTVPGIPLIYSGQEAGETKRLAFFDKDEIDWSNLEKSTFYRKLLEVKKKNRALWNGPFGGKMKRVNSGEGILAFERQKDGDAVLVMINLTDESQKTSIKTHYHHIKDIFTGNEYDIHDDEEFELGPYRFMILSGEEYTGGHHH
jgi:alpha-amylase